MFLINYFPQVGAGVQLCDEHQHVPGGGRGTSQAKEGSASQHFSQEQKMSLKHEQCYPSFLFHN